MDNILTRWEPLDAQYETEYTKDITADSVPPWKSDNTSQLFLKTDLEDTDPDNCSCDGSDVCEDSTDDSSKSDSDSTTSASNTTVDPHKKAATHPTYATRLPRHDGSVYIVRHTVILYKCIKSK